MAAQKKSGSVITILTLLLNPRDARKSQGEITQNLLWWRRLGCLRLDCSQAKRLASATGLNCDGRLDRWVRVVADKLEIFEFEIVNVFYGGIQFHLW